MFVLVDHFSQSQILWMMLGNANLFQITIIAEIANERAVIKVFSKSMSSQEVLLLEEWEDDDDDVE